MKLGALCPLLQHAYLGVPPLCSSECSLPYNNRLLQQHSRRYHNLSVVIGPLGPLLLMLTRNECLSIGQPLAWSLILLYDRLSPKMFQHFHFPIFMWTIATMNGIYNIWKQKFVYSVGILKGITKCGTVLRYAVNVYGQRQGRWRHKGWGSRETVLLGRPWGICSVSWLFVWEDQPEHWKIWHSHIGT